MTAASAKGFFICFIQDSRYEITNGLIFILGLMVVTCK